MDLINSFLRRENILDENDVDATSQEEKLEVFHSMFSDLERKYMCTVDDMQQLELEHKEELNQLQAQIYQIKQLTDEREKVSKDEVEELQSKVKSLEKQLEDSLQKKTKNRHDSSFQSDDDLSEATIEILVYEGFGNIVNAPNHEKIAVLLHDRSTKIDEIIELKNKVEELSKKLTNSNSKASAIEELEFEIENLKLVNEKVCNELAKLKTHNASLEEMNKENEMVLSENTNLKLEINKLSQKLDFDKVESDEILTASRLEIAKLKESDLNLKMEIDRLFDEISSFETECKQLREQNKNLLLNKAESTSGSNEKDLAEIRTLKQEIDDLNEELDELVQFKADYESLKLDYDKLNAQVQLNSSQIESPRRSSNLTPSNSFRSKAQIESVAVSPVAENNKTRLELDWIKGENEKLLLELEKVQMKLDEKCAGYNSLRETLAEKDEQMNVFIKKYEGSNKNQKFDEEDMLTMQKKMLDLEHLLAKEKEEKLAELESNEERQKDLLKRNDTLWSQLTNMELSYKETVNIVRQQTERINELEAACVEDEKNLMEIEAKLTSEVGVKEELKLRNKELNADLDELREQNESFKVELKEKVNEIGKLREHIARLENELYEARILSDELRKEIESLGKEKAFIVEQSASREAKVMQEFLAVQEKCAEVSYELGKASKEKEESLGVVNEKEACISGLRTEKKELESEVKREKREKAEALEKIGMLEALTAKNIEVINELTENQHRLEIQKSKLEIKAKELEAMELKFDQIYNELNDKRDSLSQVLEKNARLESQVNHIESRLSDTKHSLIQAEAVINELNQVKASVAQKTEANITLKHDYENEKSRRDKTEKKLEETKDDLKKLKQKMARVTEENTLLKNESIEIKNQLDGFKSKISLIADKSHTELEKNTTLQGELSEVKKKLELAEMKCANYSDKFDLLLKKYEARKIRQKNKIERLWEYLQRERAKYKNLLANAQNDLSTTKSFIEKENENKSKHEVTHQQITEENSKLKAIVADKESKMREMKRQNLNLQSKIKLFEEEMESLHERIELTAKERNKYRKELQLNIFAPVSNEIFGSSLISGSYIPPSSKGKISKSANVEPLEKCFKSNSMISSTKYWNDLINNDENNTHSATVWDVNYNTGYLNRFAGFLDAKPSFDLGLSANNILKNKSDMGKMQDINFGGSVATDLNSSSSTPRSFK